MEPVFVIVIAIVLILLLQELPGYLSEREGANLELNFKRNGVLVGSEVSLSFQSNFSIGGRVDQVWTVPDKGYLLVDTKNRARAAVYDSDRLQLSIYAWLLRREAEFADKAALESAFVRIPSRKGPTNFLPLAGD